MSKIGKPERETQNWGPGQAFDSSIFFREQQPRVNVFDVRIAIEGLNAICTSG
jgi:hypothetical protein